MFCEYLRIYIFQYWSFFFKFIHWAHQRTKEMTEQNEIINLGKFEFDDNNEENKLWFCLR